jgi:exodeoxyribonuclease-5
MLTEHQQEKFDEIINWFEDKDGSKFMCLKGAAGTGKTFVASTIAAKLHCDYNKILITATTNAASKVIGDKAGIESMTIHRLLGLRISNAEDKLFLEKSSSYYQNRTNYDLVIVDEASMVNEEIFQEIMGSERSLKWLFVGDHCQLLPVGDAISPCFSLPTAHLKEIVRQDNDNPISGVINELRILIESNAQTMPKFYTKFTDDKANGLWYYDASTIRDWYAQVIGCFKSKNGVLLNHGRIVTLKNKTENFFNNTIRKAVINKEEAFTCGEVLRFKSSYIECGSMVMPSGGWLTITDVNPTTINPNEFSDFLPEAAIPGYFLKGENEYGELKIILTIVPGCEGMLERWKNISAIAIRKLNQRHRGAAWKSWWDFVNGIADVSYRYASTVRRVQGETITNVFPVIKDLISCPSEDSKLRNLYVALTRAKSKIIGVN